MQTYAIAFRMSTDRCCSTRAKHLLRLLQLLQQAGDRIGLRVQVHATVAAQSYISRNRIDGSDSTEGVTFRVDINALDRPSRTI